MNKETKLNQKVAAQVVDDLIRAKMVKFTIVKDEGRGLVSRHVTFTKDGTEMIAGYVKGFKVLRNPTKRKVEAFNDFLSLQALGYLRHTGELER
jgi:hypothetical protein